MIEIVDARPLQPYTLEVAFNDGTVRRVDIEDLLWGEMFEPIRDPEYFALAESDPDLGTAVSPNGTDLAPEFLHERGRVVSPSSPG